MTNDAPAPHVLQLRLVVETEDFDDAVAFYRDVLGLREQESFQSEGEARIVILDAGRATLELANPAQVRAIDDVEVGRPISPKIRVAFEVPDTARTTEALSAAGATVLAPPVETPWRSLNARLAAPAGIQITIFQELER
jgi:catechol 2,3-dioxygenase-like lactoylglutathione lyase family enzyme